jgi:hypothetical protein
MGRKKLRLQYRQASEVNKVNKWFLQEKTSFFFWNDVDIKGIKLYSHDKERLLTTIERSFSIRITETAEIKDITHLIYISK